MSETAEYCAQCRGLVGETSKLECCQKNYCSEACLANHNEKSEAHKNGEWHRPSDLSPSELKPLKAVDIKPEAVKVSESAVSLIEHWLEMAKAGELSDVILVGIRGDSVIHGASKTMNFLSRLGAIEATKMEWYHEDVLHKGNGK